MFINRKADNMALDDLLNVSSKARIEKSDTNKCIINLISKWININEKAGLSTQKVQ